KQILASKDKASDFLWRVLTATSFYAASLVPEISDDVLAVDRAMEWGYGWGMGPFRTMDAVGVAALAERAKAGGVPVPGLIEKLLASGRKSFYAEEDGRQTMFGPTGVTPVPERTGVIEVAAVGARGGVHKKKGGASLVDLGDGVGLVEFHSKMNALGTDTFAIMNAAVKEGRANFDALVIGNQAENST